MMREVMITTQREKVMPSTRALLDHHQTAFFESLPKNTLYTAAVRDGNTDNAYLLRLRYYLENNNSPDLYYVWVHTNGCAEDIAQVWSDILWGGETVTDFAPFFSYKNTTLEWAVPLTLKMGDTIDHMAWKELEDTTDYFAW
jgi:hypothetical protein